MTVTMKPRPTTYNGIEMRSRLEARVAAWLNDIVGCDWRYEPRAFAGSGGQYLPDFQLDGIARPDGKKTTWYLEIKPTMPDNDRVSVLSRRMQTILASEPDAGLLLAWPSLLEVGCVWVSPTRRMGMLMSCPHHPGNLFFARSFDFPSTVYTFGGLCQPDCDGVAVRPEDGASQDPRLAMPRWSES